MYVYITFNTLLDRLIWPKGKTQYIYLNIMHRKATNLQENKAEIDYNCIICNLLLIYVDPLVCLIFCSHFPLFLVRD